jgi:ferredoxin-fold anticodon binding domain-containing protein
MKQNTLKDIDADSLILHKVSILYTPQLAEHAAALELNELQLGTLDDLSEVSANGLLHKHVHVVVEIPNGAWVYVVLSSLR